MGDENPPPGLSTKVLEELEERLVVLELLLCMYPVISKTGVINHTQIMYMFVP